MANTDAPNGARVVGHMAGGTAHRMTEYLIASGYAENIFDGDFVRLVAGGGIEVAGATERLLGVFAGCKYTNAAGEQIFSKYWPTGTVAADAKALVYDDPYMKFAIQTDAGIDAADVGTLADIVAGAGNTLTGRSGFEINGSGGTGDAQLRILGKVDTPDNDWGTNVEVIVQIYEHEFTNADHSTPGV